MSENEVKTESLNLDQIRQKLFALVEMWADKLPEILGNQKNTSAMEKMLLTSFRPFLPRLQDSLMSKIDSMTDDEIENMVQKLERALVWLKAND